MGTRWLLVQALQKVLVVYYRNRDRLRLVAVLPQASVAINVLTTVYSLAQAPAVVASVLVTEAAPQASDAVGKAKEGVSGHSIVAGAGTAENTGGVLS